MNDWNCRAEFIMKEENLLKIQRNQIKQAIYNIEFSTIENFNSKMKNGVK